MKINIEDIRAQLSAEGGALITEEYKNLQEEMEYECPEGHRVFGPGRRFRDNCTCPVCKNNEYKQKDNKIHSNRTGAKRILALDQATHVSGWSVYDGDKLIKYGTYTAPSKSEIDRYDAIKNWLISMIQNGKPDHIGLEGIQYQAKVGVTTFESLARLQGILMECCFELHIPFTICPTNTGRHQCGVKGSARADRKNSAKKIIKEKYDVSVTDDEADSILIGQYLANTLKNSEIIEGE